MQIKMQINRDLKEFNEFRNFICFEFIFHKEYYQIENNNCDDITYHHLNG